MTQADELEGLLDFLKANRGFDFTGYKRPSLERRIRMRMEAVGVGSFAGYLEYLEVHPDEFELLFNTILINVTAFFRDQPAWTFLTEEVLPKLLAAREGQPLRVWCAGCSDGMETYTIAMVLAEALGAREYVERVKIYATDVDEESLELARQAAYAAKQVEGVPEELLERYFEPDEDRYVVRPDVRRTVIFGRNDLVQDAPISRVDLLVCRNTLMYFNAETQSRILRRFHFALNPDGYLFLGKSEMLIAHADLFAPASLKRRVFTKVAPAGVNDRRTGGPLPGRHFGVESSDHIRDSAFEASVVAQLVVAREGQLLLANQRARALLGVESADLGRPLQDLEVSYRPVELRSILDDLYAHGATTTVKDVLLTDVGGDRRTLEVEVSPLHAGDEVVGASLSYVDVTEQHAVQDELERSRRELSTAYEELQSTVEELETTNEELQSTNEELETTNEELQSTNEELETMNEELQSTNEELVTMNDELRQRSTDLKAVNAFTETILSAMGVAVMVVDRSQTVRNWNRHAEELWGIRRDEAEGDHMLNLDIGLPVDELRGPLRDALNGEALEPAQVTATDRRGRQFLCQVRALALRAGPDEEVSGVIVLMERAASAEAPDGAARAPRARA